MNFSKFLLRSKPELQKLYVAWASNVGSYGVRVGCGVQTDATSPNNVDPKTPSNLFSIFFTRQVL